MFFDWLQRRLAPSAPPTRRGEPKPSIAPESHTTESAPAEYAAAASAPADGPLPALDAAALQTQIESRLQTLLSQLPAPIRNTDAPEILSLLGTDSTAIIHQPPLAAQQTLAMSRRENCSVRDLVQFFEGDPGLAQALLRHANSSFYAGRGGRSLSVLQAVQTIGTSGVENVVLASMVQTMLCRPGGSYDSLVQQVWSHMVRTGPIARDLADAFRVEPERAFTLSLLHDAGKLVLFDRISAFRKEKKREVNFPHHLLLWALKRLHEPIGGLAALKWGFEDAAVRAIATHHREPVPAQEDRLSGVVYLAEKFDLATAKAQPFDLDAVWAAGDLTGDIETVRALLEDQDQDQAEAA